MRPPSENLRSSATTFHSISVGGRFCGLLKKISYSIFRRRSWVSSTFNSSSVVTVFSTHSVVIAGTGRQIPVGHEREWDESKVRRACAPGFPAWAQGLFSHRDGARRASCPVGILGRRS